MYCCSLRRLWNRAMFPSVNISLSRPFWPSQHSIYHLLCAFAMSAPSSAVLALLALTSRGLFQTATFLVSPISPSVYGRISLQISAKWLHCPPNPFFPRMLTNKQLAVVWEPLCHGFCLSSTLLLAYVWPSTCIQGFAWWNKADFIWNYSFLLVIGRVLSKQDVSRCGMWTWAVCRVLCLLRRLTWTDVVFLWAGPWQNLIQAPTCHNVSPVTSAKSLFQSMKMGFQSAKGGCNRP